MQETNIKSNKTICCLRKLLREVCIETFINNAQKIGGANKIVQIDETLVFRRKYNVGRLLRQIWLVGGVCPEDSSLFLVKVHNKSAQELRNFINMWVKSGSQIRTSSWSAYFSGIDKNLFEHETINHTIEFIILEGVHTQNIENTWCVLKKFLRKTGYSHGKKEHLVQYLAEFLYKKKFNRNLQLFVLYSRNFAENTNLHVENNANNIRNNNLLI